MAGRSSPQEKKRLSYAKDRRNDYGENDKSSRKNIRRNKRACQRPLGSGSGTNSVIDGCRWLGGEEDPLS